MNRALLKESFEQMDDSAEFGTNDPNVDILDGSEYAEVKNILANRIETPVTVPLSHVTSGDPTRPRNRQDDSIEKSDGSKQATIDQLCGLSSISWAEDILKMKGTNAAQSLTMVMTHNL